MVFFIGDEKINISKIELMHRYINEGSEGTLYQIGKEAVKIYNKEYYGKRLNEDEAKKLSKIDTKRVLLPKRLVYNENKKFIGYTSDFKMEYYKDALGRLTMEKFLEELNHIRYDFKILSENGIIVEDLHQNNVIMSDGIYICDPGMYKIDNKENYEKIYRNNIAELNFLFTVILLESYFGLTKKQSNALERYFEPSFRLFIDKLQEEQEINPKQKVSPYFKKLSLKFM